MLIQEKPFFHQQHLRTCVNDNFSALWSLFSLRTATCIFNALVSKIEVWRKFERSRNFLQRSRFFVMEVSLSEKVIQSETLSTSEFNPYTFSLITYKSGLVLYHLICCFLDSMSTCMFYCSYCTGGRAGSFFYFFRVDWVYYIFYFTVLQFEVILSVVTRKWFAWWLT